MQQKNPSVKNRFSLYLFSISVALGSLVLGYQLVCLTMLQKQISFKNSLSEKENTIYLSLATSALPFGCLISTFFYKSLTKQLGQAKIMKYCDIIIILILLVQLITLNINLIIVLRLFIGLVIGTSATAVPSYLISIAPTSESGKIGSLNQILITVGIALAYAMGFTLNQNQDDELQWRIFVGFPIAFCFIRTFYLQNIYKFDTIQRHIIHHQVSKLREYIDNFYVKGTMSVQKLTLIKMPKQKKQDVTQTHKSKGYKYRVILSFVLIFINQFSGINAIMFYANQLFQNISNGNHQQAVWMSFYLGIFQILVTIISGSLLDKFGRKTLMAFGLLLITLALLGGFYIKNVSEGVDSFWLNYVVFVHVGGFSLSLGPVTILYISQILQDITPFMLLLWIETLIISLTSNIMINNMGIGIVFLLYGIVAGLGLIIIIIFMKQSKGLARNQLIFLFESKKQNYSYSNVSEQQI